MPQSTARVTTDRPQRYAKQLASHLGRRSQSSWDEEAGTGEVVFADGFGKGTLTAEPGTLVLTVEGEADSLDRLEDVFGRHLVRFGTKDELVVAWQRDTGEAGTVQRLTEDD